MKIKNEDEELMDKKTTAQDGSIEFRGLFKNKSYHVEFYNYDERIKDADKIYLKDQFKTEEITKAETGFDYFIFVGDNLSFSELGTRDAREDTPEEIAAKQTNNQIVSTQNEEKQETETEKIKEDKKEIVAVTTENNQESAKTSNEVKQEETNAKKIEENNATTQKTANADVESKQESSIAIVNNEVKQEEPNAKKIEENNTTTQKTESTEVAVNKESINENKQTPEPIKSETVSEEKKQETSNNEKKSDEIVAVKKSDEKQNEATENTSLNKSNVVDFSSFKDKDFNSPETHALLVKEEGKISIKKINFKVQVGAYTNQEVANQVKIYGFGSLDKQNYPDGFTRITLGNCKSLKEAEELRKKIIAKGINGAWIVGFLDGKRYTMKELATNNFFQ